MKKIIAAIALMFSCYTTTLAQENSKYDYAVLITASGDAKWTIYYSNSPSEDLGKVDVPGVEEYYKTLFKYFAHLNSAGYEMESSLACANCSKSFYFKRAKKK